MTQAAVTDLESQLRRDEGERRHVYADSEGFLTIGIGRLVDRRKAGSGLSSAECTHLLHNDLHRIEIELGSALPWIYGLEPVRRAVLHNMAFQLGTAGLLKFRRTLALVKEMRYAEAAREMLDSRWAQQTPARAHRLARQMATNTWQ
jgi:lysozyme